MKHIHTPVLWLMLICSSVAVGQTDTTRSDQFELTGEIIGTISLPPHCGYFSFAVAIEFRIVDFSISDLPSETIGLIVPCPEFYGDNFFVVGTSYQLLVTQNEKPYEDFLIWNSSIVSKYALARNFWVEDAKKED